METPEDPEEVAQVEEAKKPVEVTAEDLADEEWGPVKGKKSKKGKGKKGKNDDEAEEDGREGTSHISVAPSILLIMIKLRLPPLLPLRKRIRKIPSKTRKAQKTLVRRYCLRRKRRS